MNRAVRTAVPPRVTCGDLDDTPALSDLDTAAGARGHHLVGAGVAARVDHDLDLVALQAGLLAFSRIGTRAADVRFSGLRGT